LKTKGATNHGAIRVAFKICHPARAASVAFNSIWIGKRDSAPRRSFARRFARADTGSEENVMKKLQLAAIVLLCLSSTAFAQSAPYHRHHRRAPPPAPVSDQYSAMMPSAPSASGITHNANDCAPDRAEAVWGAGSALVGYSCVTPNAN